MHGQRLLVFGAGLIAACSSSHPNAPTTGTVRGIVASSLGGGLTGLSVTVTPASAAALPAVVTGAGGAFSVPNVPLGTGSVSVSGQPSLCAPPSSTAYSFDSGDTAVANVKVSCAQPTGSIGGGAAAIYGPNLRVYLPGATVTVTPAGGSPLPPVTVDGNGEYRVDSIPLPVVNGQAQLGTGKVVLSATLPGGCPASPVTFAYSGLSDTNTATSPLPVAITPACTGSTLTASVTYPLPGRAPVNLVGPNFFYLFFTGTQTFSPVLPGTYVMSAMPLSVLYDSILGYAAVVHMSGSPATIAPGATGTMTATYVERPGTGQIWVASSRGATAYTLAALNQSGVASGITISPPSGAPRVMTTDSGGNLWMTGAFGVAEYAVGTLPTLGGSYSPPSNPTATFALPHASAGAAGIAFDPAGHLWVSDVANAAIYAYNGGSPTPVVTVSGSPLRAPIRIAFDRSGNLWVADSLAHSVFMYLSAQIQSTGSPTPQTLSVASVFPGGGPYAIAFDWSGDFYVGGATIEGPAGQDSGLVAWYTGVYPQYLTTPNQVWRFVGQSFAPGTAPARPPVVDLATDHTLGVWAIANNGIVNFVYDSTVRFNANPPVVTAAATDLNGLTFDVSPLAVIPIDTGVTSTARAGRRPTINRRGGLSRAAVRP